MLGLLLSDLLNFFIVLYQLIDPGLTGCLVLDVGVELITDRVVLLLHVVQFLPVLPLTVPELLSLVL